MLDIDHKQIIKRLTMHFAVEYLFFNRSNNCVLNGAIEDLSIIIIDSKYFPDSDWLKARV